MLVLRLSAETEERLDHIAKVSGRSKHFYAVQALETHLGELERKYLSDQERAEVQALVDFGRVEMALAGDLDPDRLTPIENAHYFDATVDTVSAMDEITMIFYQHLGRGVGACGVDENDEIGRAHV